MRSSESVPISSVFFGAFKKNNGFMGLNIEHLLDICSDIRFFGHRGYSDK